MPEGMTDDDGYPIHVLEIRVRYYGEKGQEYVQATIRMTREYLEDSIMGPRHAAIGAFLQLFDDVNAEISTREKK